MCFEMVFPTYENFKIPTEKFQNTNIQFNAFQSNNLFI